MNSLKWKNISNKIQKEIYQFFLVSDEVKFAKQIPIQKDNVESFKMIKNLIINERIDIKVEQIINKENNV